ncbi:MAG: FtsW/RodA/SpoVE family cell cycle protein [Gemmatimonadaceae bacterium]
MTATIADVRYRWYMGPEARLILFITACLLAFGLATVYSASAIYAQTKNLSSGYFILRQLVGVAAGIVGLAILSKIDAEKWSKYAWPLMLFSLVLLLLIILPFTQSIAPRIRGSRRFLIGASLQPSELGKIALIIWTSMLIVKKGDALRGLTKGLLPFLVIVGLMDVLVALEPDLSVAMMYTLIMGIILFAGGVRIGHFVVLGIVAIPLLWTQMQRLNYVLLRMTAFFDPGAAPTHVSDQLRQSLIAVGSGKILGVGFGQGRQPLGFLPLAYDDFIAGSIGEEWGFVGMLVLVLAFAAFAFLGFRIAHKARSTFLQLVAVGITSTIVITAFLHIGVVIGMLPTTGLTLPFVSFGRSNMVLSLVMTGILVNIGSTREKVIGSRATDPSFEPRHA